SVMSWSVLPCDWKSVFQSCAPLSASNASMWSPTRPYGGCPEKAMTLPPVAINCWHRTSSPSLWKVHAVSPVVNEVASSVDWTHVYGNPSMMTESPDTSYGPNM